MSHLDEAGSPMRWSVLTDKQAICRSGTHAPMGIFAPGYAMHQYDEWLLTTVADLLDDDLSISSAGLLRGGAIAWVEVSVPESISTPEGVVFRPNLLATTSFDGSIATTFKRTVTDVVCDNTREARSVRGGRRSRSSTPATPMPSWRRHGRRWPWFTASPTSSQPKSPPCAPPPSPITSGDRFLDAHVPRIDSSGAPLTGRADTLADKKRESLQRLYRHDQRVAPWAGTAHGVLQAVNTYEHHEGTVRGSGRAERNMLRTVTGDFGRVDRSTLQTLEKVLV